MPKKTTSSISLLRFLLLSFGFSTRSLLGRCRRGRRLPRGLGNGGVKLGHDGGNSATTARCRHASVAHTNGLFVVAQVGNLGLLRAAAGAHHQTAVATVVTPLEERKARRTLVARRRRAVWLPRRTKAHFLRNMSERRSGRLKCKSKHQKKKHTSTKQQDQQNSPARC